MRRSEAFDVMKDFAIGMFNRAIAVVALSAILVSVSEFWFYEVGEDVDSVLILLDYGLLGYLFMVLSQRFRVRRLAGFIVSAALLGFLIEGVPVPVVYTAPPLSIVWTSLAWHGLITVGLGWALFRYVMIEGTLWNAALLNIAFGVFLGLWNGFMWNASTIEATGEIVFRWHPIDAFVEQFLFGYALFLGGHVLLDRLFSADMRFGRLEHIGLWGLAGAISVLVAFGHGVIALYPIFPVLVVFCLMVLRHEEQTGPASPGWSVGWLYKAHIPIWRYGLTLGIPFCAILAYGVLVHFEIGLEMNVVVILTAGPAAVILLIWSVFRIYRGSGTAPEMRER